MFGGGEGLLVRCRHVLDPIGTTIVPVGGVGCRHAMKALNSLLEIGRRFGLDPKVMLQVINSSTGRNHATEHEIA